LRSFDLGGNLKGFIASCHLSHFVNSDISYSEGNSDELEKSFAYICIEVMGTIEQHSHDLPVLYSIQFYDVNLEMIDDKVF
jgi:hypothetical protein